MRMQRSITNSAAVLASQFLSTSLGIITRTVFMYTLSQEYLGINQLLNSVISVLCLSELGIGTAIIYALYKPLADNDEERISALMNLYAKAYKLIGCIVAVLGVAVFPFLHLIVSETPDISNFFIIYLLYIFNTASSFFFSYKRALITADQRDWVNILNQSLFLIIQNVLQILLLVVTGEYMLYLIAQISCSVLSNVFISRKANRMYPYLLKHKEAKVDKETTRTLKKNISAMLLHQIGSVLVSGTDNILIGWVGLAVLGIYSNYTLVIQVIAVVLVQIFRTITASLGNLVATENLERQYDMHGHIFFTSYWLYGFFAVSLLTLLHPFMTVWAPENYLLPNTTTFLIVLNFFLFGMRQTNIMYVNTVGLFWPLRYKTAIEALINLVTSYYFLVVMDLGVDGVLMGTVLSSMCTNFWWEPYQVVKKHLGKPLKGYFLRWVWYLASAVVAYFASSYLCSLVTAASWLGFIIKGVICTVVVNAVFLAFFGFSGDFRYLLNSLMSIVGKRLKLGANKST